MTKKSSALTIPKCDFPTPDIAEQFSDEVLLAKLHELGIEIDRPTMEKLCDGVISVEELSEPFEEKFNEECFAGVRKEAREVDWIWICFVTLWKRWFPDKICFEILDDDVTDGYDFVDNRKPAQALVRWRAGWNNAFQLADKTGLTIEKLHERLQTSWDLNEWFLDTSVAYTVASLRNPTIHLEFMEICDGLLERCESDHDDRLAEFVRVEMALSLFVSGQSERVDSLYKEWLNRDPQWGFGWISWHSCYTENDTSAEGRAKAEKILRDGIAVSKVRDRHEIIETLGVFLQERGRMEEGDEILERLDRGLDFEIPMMSYSASNRPGRTSVERLPTASQNVRLGEVSQKGGSRAGLIGRKEPCPCGSGKKYKRCCG